MPSIITLTTDFGLEDEYAGVLKGVMLGLAPQVRLIDLCHTIRPQDIRQGAFILQAAAPYFPKDTIHLAIVDPEVGTNRRLLAVRAMGQVFLGPDNGILTPFLHDQLFEEAIRIDCPQLYLDPAQRDLPWPRYSRPGRGRLGQWRRTLPPWHPGV